MSYAHPQSSAGRLTGLVVTVALHIVLIYALIHGLARKIVEIVTPPLETKIIEEIKPPPDKPPPPPPPKLATPPPPFIPPPEVNIQFPAQQAPTITVVTPVAPPPSPAPLAPTPPPQVIPAQRDASSCENPPYPAGSRRANEEGVVRVRLLIDANGTVLDSKIERSSGYRRLDQAAMEALLQCKYRPMTVGGQPVRGWVPIDYVWRLTDAR